MCGTSRQLISTWPKSPGQKDQVDAGSCEQAGFVFSSMKLEIKSLQRTTDKRQHSEPEVMVTSCQLLQQSSAY